MPTVKGGNLQVDDEEQSGLALDELEFNLEDIPETPKLGLIPGGIYDAEVEDCEFKYSAKDNPMLHWIFKVSVPIGDDEGTVQYRKLHFYTVLNETGFGKTRDAVVRVAPEIPLNPFRPKDAAFMLVGKPCRVNVRQENDKEDRTQKRNFVKDVLAPSEDQSSFFAS